MRRDETAVAVIGLGPMGHALASAFLSAGHPTTVWNRTATRADALVERGARRAASVADAARAAAVVVVCLRDDDAVGEVLEPAAEALRGRTLVNLTSATPGQARARGAWSDRHGVDYLDGVILTPTPTIGTSAAKFLYCGSASAHRGSQHVLAALGDDGTYLGDDPGQAAARDVAFLAFFWLSVLGLVHGLALARAEAVPAGQFTPSAHAIAAMLPEMAARFAAQLESSTFPGERSTIASGAAGLGHLVEAAAEHGFDTTVLDSSNTFLQRALAAGHGDDGLARLADILGPVTAPARSGN